jgi:hypothetical protein
MSLIATMEIISKNKFILAKWILLVISIGVELKDYNFLKS